MNLRRGLVGLLLAPAGGPAAAARRHLQSDLDAPPDLRPHSRPDPPGPPPDNTCQTEAECNARRQQLGFPDNIYYVNDYSRHYLYGCFSKNGKAYWGEGGTAAQNGAHPLTGIKERIWCDSDPTLNPTPTLSPTYEP